MKRLDDARLSALVLAAWAAAFSHAAAAEDHAERQAEIPDLKAPAMTAQDLITMPRLGAPTVDPSGRRAVYSVTITDPESYVRKRVHYSLDLQSPGAEPVALDLGLSANSLSFAKDGFLYFLSFEHTNEDEEARSRLWRIAVNADATLSDPMLVADVPGTDIEGFLVSPTGDKVALIAHLPRDCPNFGCETNEEPIGSGRLYEGDAGFVRHWDRWIKPGHFNRVFVFGMEDGQAIGDGVAIPKTA